METKKENKLKKFVIDHESEIKETIRDMCWYALGIGVGYVVFGPNKVLRKWHKSATKGTLVSMVTDETLPTLAEIVGDNSNYLNDVIKMGYQPSDKVTGIMLGIAKN